MTHEELADAYRSGELRALVADEFAFWIDDRCNELNAKHGKTLIDVIVQGVSMRAAQAAVRPDTK